MMVLDGVFGKNSKLPRGQVLSLGAGWVPEMLKRLDYVVKTWSRVDKNLSEIKKQFSRAAIRANGIYSFPLIES